MPVLMTCKGVFGSRFGFGLASQLSLDSQSLTYATQDALV